MGQGGRRRGRSRARGETYYDGRPLPAGLIAVRLPRLSLSPPPPFSAFSSLPLSRTSRWVRARVSLFVQADVCAQTSAFSLPSRPSRTRGTGRRKRERERGGGGGERERPRGDPDREIVGIRGVTRADLLLAHNRSICLRSSGSLPSSPRPVPSRPAQPPSAATANVEYCRPVLARIESRVSLVIYRAARIASTEEGALANGRTDGRTN